MPLPNLTRTCGAKTKKGPCPQPPMPNGRCRIHGGATPEGWASPSYKDGQHVRRRNLPVHLAESYETARKDPDLLSLREEISTTDARIDELWDNVNQDNPVILWQGLLAAYSEMEKHKAAANGTDTTAALSKVDFWNAFDNLGLLIAHGCDDLQKKREIRAEEEHRRKLVDSERARLKDANLFITSEKAVTMVQILVSCIRRHVTDYALLAKIQRDFARVFDPGDSSGSGTESGT